MFSKLSETKYPPKQKPIMVFDGKCGFCKYWVIKWKKISGLGVEYKPYQEVYQNFPDIEKDHFKQAVRFITTSGKIYNGPDAAYITYYNKQKVQFLHKWYTNKRWFRKLSDSVYQWIADHRNFMSKVSVRMFGKNPANPKPYWKIYLALLIILIVSLVFALPANT